jgi:short-subunit dehydrogenase
MSLNIILITGASSGMGRETARQLDKIYTDKIDEIWLIARRRNRLEELANELSHPCHILEMDLADKDSFEKLDAELKLLDCKIKFLVNAAGFGVAGKFTENDLSRQLEMINVNCVALTAVTGIALKYMPDNSRILQYASSAAFVPQPGFSIYAATKSFVLSFSESLNAELKPRNISVTAVCPGPVDTEFFEIAGNTFDTFELKKSFMANEKDVVKEAIVDAYNRRPLSIHKLSMKAFRMLTQSVPEEAMVFALRKIMEATDSNNEDEQSF